MADRSLRGMRLGSQSLQSEDGVVFSERIEQHYRCSECSREMILMFAAEAEPPQTWNCRFCGAESVLLVDSEPVDVEREDGKQARTHWDMLLERRSRDELEELLQERLQYLRERRGQTTA
ncbi:MAG: RNA polymerase-binding protein RbpA [Mycetocola sp.]